MAITAADVNKLRQMTGSGMMDCKNALVEANGDFDAAIDILRKKGQKVAAKRADRTSNQGRVVAKMNAEHTFAAIVVVSCETDFVAKNSDFVNFADSIIDAAIANKIKTREELMVHKINGVTVEDMLVEMTGKTGEKTELPAFEVIEAHCVAAYNHHGNLLATIAGFAVGGEKVFEPAHNVAMQIAAMNPLSVDPKQIPQATIDHELELAREMTRQEGKPENMIEKIAEGKLNKFFKENTLLSQEYIRDNKLSVADYLKQTDANLTCCCFHRLQIGA
ncbi:MAG: translation elongation factor Ts [Bacteroidales bacterium]|jgi:elongation factor Ts|nr:translation elongation factor Ts [Bacteroidales bacterium]